MPRTSSRGGVRLGTPGKAYSNRTDLLANRAPQTGTQTAASAGVPAPPPPAPAAPQPTYLTPDQIPKLDDPSARPDEPVTAGIDSGPGPGSSALGGVPQVDPALAHLQAAYLAFPTPELRRAIHRMSLQGLL